MWRKAAEGAVGFRKRAQLLGLSRELNAATAQHLNERLYAQASPHQRALEAEAYANQDQLSIGQRLIVAHCF